jgi:hypothetical protein
MRLLDVFFESFYLLSFFNYDFFCKFHDAGKSR